MKVYCTGETSYDARVELPHGVFLALEGAKASVSLREGEEWAYDAKYHEWTVRRNDAGDHSEIIKAFEVQP